MKTTLQNPNDPEQFDIALSMRLSREIEFVRLFFYLDKWVLSLLEVSRAYHSELYRILIVCEI